jgi:hypothetical protein
MNGFHFMRPHRVILYLGIVAFFVALYINSVPEDYDVEE